ncbi:MAG: 16S rRNA (guanine(527)-N(7))-methyltransferase RsmG [Candidatus Syntrophosphaera sp.]
MKDPKAEFIGFLEKLGLERPEEVLARFEHFHALLLEKNLGVNLISRATASEDVWTKHFLDSLLPLKCLDLQGKKLLDFGSGGGLPGIPIKLAVPGCRMTLLDSVRKKTVAMREFVDQLGLKDCNVECVRLEDFHPQGEGFDYILCRAVRLEQRYLKPLRQILAKGGGIIFYKAQDVSDIAGLAPKLLVREEFSFGERSLYLLNGEQLKPDRIV